jgi:hypothetical protein
LTEVIREGRCGVRDLLQSYDHMAIPHFQRGLVWDPGSVALLLESLYFGTPCGSILLWRPDDPAKHGVKLGKRPEYLIIDGQQRIRSLQDVFGHDSADRAEREEEAGQEREPEAVTDESASPADVWCLNLARLSEFEDQFEDGGRFRLFGRHRDPLVPAADDAGRPNFKQRLALLPLRWFLEHESDPERLETESRETTAAAAVKALLSSPSVHARVARIVTALLFDVRVLGPEYDLKGVVSAYNRINSAGKRVESEERAFASLVSVTTYTESALRHFFSTSRPDRQGSPVTRSSVTDGIDRDDLVRREKENRFGFKLFMRAFVITFAYHSDRSIGSSSFSFNSVDGRHLEKGSKHLKHILDSTVRLLSSTAEILRTKLYCDDFRMLPETSSLWPVFQCMVRFPGLASTYPDWIAAATLRLMLSDLTMGQLLRLVAQVNDAPDAAEAMAVFDGRPLRAKSVAATIRRGVRRAQSLTDKYALLLYWLIRQHRAKDFSYDANLPEAKATDVRLQYGLREDTGEPDVSADVQPQKQHLVPYTRLKEMFGLSGARPGRHEAHDIGNLTYISEALNGLTGLGSDPLDLDREPAGNRDAHFIGGRDVLPAFSRACADGEVKSYRDFCRRRRKLIEGAFLIWDTEMWKARGMSRVRHPAEPPTRRLLAPTLEDQLRDLKYPDEVTQHLVRLPALGFREGRAAADDDRRVRLVLRAGKGTQSRRRTAKRQRVRLDLFVGRAKLAVKVSDSGLKRRFARDLEGIDVRIRKGAVLCQLATGDKAGRGEALRVLEWLTGRLS